MGKDSICNRITFIAYGLNMSTLNVIVVGGGPAGCAAAYTLANRSINVTIFERGLPGKDKACGDALVSSAVDLMSMFEIDINSIEALGGHRCDRVDTYIYEFLTHQVEYDNNAVWVIPRAVIDQEIRNIISSRVLFRYETQVMDIMINPNGDLMVSVKNKNGINEQVRCDAVILATGSMNWLSRKLGIDGSPSKAFGISMYAEVLHTGNLVFQFVDSCEPGYRWIFPISDKTANIGVCLLTSKSQANLRLLGNELLDDHSAHPIGKWRGGWGPMWSGLGQIWHHSSGIVSCGDAAGLVNPYGGEGIAAALQSGEKAGDAVANYLLGDRNLIKLHDYSDWITNHFSRQYELTPLLRTWRNLCGISE